MHRGSALLVTVLAAAIAAAASAQSKGIEKPVSQGKQPANREGWQIPANAAAEKNPVEPTPAILASGQQIYEKNCRRCHGPRGKGNGPDADPDHKPDDLTDPRRAARNPDGVMFYKVWNGRRKPKMPVFKQTLTRDEVWTVIHYVKTLRKPASGKARPA